jgi:hypothetical protein
MIGVPTIVGGGKVFYAGELFRLLHLPLSLRFIGIPVGFTPKPISLLLSQVLAVSPGLMLKPNSPQYGS